MSLVIRSPLEMQKWSLAQKGKTLGFVPTMGALHEGHETLLKRARQENELCVLSVFVNPTQFNDKNDFEKYPITWDEDFAMAERNKVDVVFAPQYSDMYPDEYRYKISENDLSLDLCGKNRPGHFDGVLSVVMKLFQTVRPTCAYFGEKDYQQLQLIKGMVTAFFLPLEIKPVPTVRESDGLAMSSRNRRLTKDQREIAPLVYKFIKNSKTAEEASARLSENSFKVDYVKDIGSRRYAAVWLGEVRLIDNVEL